MMSQNSVCLRGSMVLLVVLWVMVMVAPAAAGAEGVAEDNEAIDLIVLEDQAELIIRATYERLARYVEASGHEIVFEIDDIRTYGLPQLGGLQWTDLISMPGGDMIDMARAGHLFEDDYGSVDTIRYDPSWQLDAPPYLQTDQGKKLPGLMARSVIEQAAESWMPLRHARALTSYRVQVTFESMTRTYRAVFIWLPTIQSQRADFIAFDMITQGVDVIVREQALPVGEVPIEFLELEPGTSGLEKTGCVPSATNESSSASLSGTNDHITGQHRGAATFRSRCTCNSSCRLTCEGWISGSECVDSGLTGQCHKMTENFEGSTRHTVAGATQGISCYAGYACAQKACLFCLCNISTAVSILGSNITFSPSGNPDWLWKHEFEGDCEPCAVSAPDPPDPTPLPEGPGTPIVLDLDRRGFRFTDLAGGVRFDQDADGFREAIAWTHEGSGDAFLVLDRNGNGIIDDGVELFGDVTPQPPTAEPHGYLALAVFDHPDEGGDDDGWITPADSVFASLQLWTDSNHDGVSQAAELGSLAGAGISAPDLEYRESRRRDRHGNVLRYRSRAYLESGRRIPTVDVFLLRGP